MKVGKAFEGFAREAPTHQKAWMGNGAKIGRVEYVLKLPFSRTRW